MFSLLSCEQRYKNYKFDDSGFYYKLHIIGENNKKVNSYDYVTADLIYLTLNDSAFFKARRKFQITESDYPGSIDDCLSILSEGDSATFIINTKNFFEKTLQIDVPSFLKDTTDFKISMSILDVKKEEEFIKEKKEFLSWIEDFNEYENVLLEHYLEKQQIDIDPTNSGLYHLVIAEGNGENVKRGDTIVVNYEGRFLNGKQFDSTWRRKKAFSFIYGREWQVIPGLEEAIGRMTEEELAFFIMPSPLAFGNKGSSTGIIPPFTTVIFKVELVKVN